jgi:DNA polymerase III subunit chi
LKEVEFHTGVPDTVGFACRLLRKACRQQARVLVTAPAALLTELDRALWTFEERDFVPHIRVPGGAASVRARTPIWLAAQAGAGGLPDAPRLLVNIGAAAPADLDLLDRLIEIVGNEADEVVAGRERWRAYKAAGLQVVHHQAGDARG